jgi:hypothetical protein
MNKQRNELKENTNRWMKFKTIQDMKEEINKDKETLKKKSKIHNSISQIIS